MHGKMCCSCGYSDGSTVGDRVTQVSSVPVFRPALMPADESRSEGFVPLCQVCAEKMPIDMALLYKAQLGLRDQQGTPDALLEEFARQFIVGVWPGSEAPSYQELANVLNACGLYSPQGALWSCHNLQQKLTRMQFDKDSTFRLRVRQPLAVGGLLATAAAYLSSKSGSQQPYGEPPASEPQALFPVLAAVEPPDGMPG